MKKILGTTIVLLGAAALSATAATVQIDLSGYDSGSDVNSSFQAYRGDPSAMANHLNEWLANSSGWCGSKANTSSETSSYFKSAVGNEDGSVTVTYTNRQGYGGSGVGLKVSLDAAGYSADAFSSLTFTVDLATSTGGTYRVYLAYQTENGWQAVESQATSGTITVTADLSGNKLTSENVYVFVESNQGRGNDSTFTASMTGELASVPEPATASLGLLGLVALMMRRPAGRQINHRTVSAWRPSFLFLLEGDNRMQCTGNRVFPAMERKTARKIIFRHASGLFFQIERPGCFCSSSGCYLCFWKFFYRAGFLWK